MTKNKQEIWTEQQIDDATQFAGHYVAQTFPKGLPGKIDQIILSIIVDAYISGANSAR